MLFDAWVAVRDFMEMGGGVLTWIALTIFVMWILIVERMLYFRRVRWHNIHRFIDKWEKRPERKSWHAHRVREALVSRMSQSANEHIPLIKTLVALCPLLGLLGTVTGMIEVFDVLALSGTGNARSMAAGVAKATIPTMAGMVGALSGVFAAAVLTRRAQRSVDRLDGNLTLDH
jgi:biopolymer transport protein ExbB